MTGGAPASARDARWDFDEVSGRVVELSSRGAGAALTGAFGLVLDAQRRGENVVWISARAAGFFAPDVAAGGVDLAALPVVLAVNPSAAGRAATHLLRSGAFGLVVLDLAADQALPAPLLTRLSGLAQHHGAALLCLTDKGDEAPSLGSLVSLRVSAQRELSPEGGFRCVLTTLKDKRRGPGARLEEICRGPDGLR
ncbi:MAG: recombinase A [Proteobacteria bacterium]|nr:MAG: recombinase A [Pseudomonadota bacterium]